MNLMRSGNRNEVIAIARETTAAALGATDVAPKLTGLPAGDPDMVRRPDRPTWEWPGLEELRDRVVPG